MRFERRIMNETPTPGRGPGRCRTSAAVRAKFVLVVTVLKLVLRGQKGRRADLKTDHDPSFASAFVRLWPDKKATDGRQAGMGRAFA